MSRERAKDFLGHHENHEVRLKNIESGVHPVRWPGSQGHTTPWMNLAVAAGWSGDVYGRLSRDIVQLRGTILGPGGWTDGVLAFRLPADIMPAWGLQMVVMHTNNKPTSMIFGTNGYVWAYRADGGSDNLIIDSIRFPRG